MQRVFGRTTKSVEEPKRIRVLLAGDDEALVRQVADILTRHSIACPSGCIVPLELAADRASRAMPDLLIMVMPRNPLPALEATQQVRSAVRTHLLVVGPAEDAKLILSTLHAGADEYVDVAQVESDLPAALLRLRRRFGGEAISEEPARVIGILAPSGGSGASTLAANLAVSLAMEHRSCGLIDMRLDAGDLTGMLNLRPVHTVAHFCERLQRVDRSMFDQMFARHASGVELLAAPLDVGMSRLITAKGIRQLLAMSRQKFPYVVVDLDNTHAEEQLETLWQSDMVLIVLRLDYTSLRNTRRLLDRMAELGIGEERLRLVVNRYRQPKELRVAQAEEALGKKIFHFIPNDPRHVHAALNQGMPLVQFAPRSAASRSLIGLAAQVNGRHVSE